MYDRRHESVGLVPAARDRLFAGGGPRVECDRRRLHHQVDVRLGYAGLLLQGALHA